MTISPRDVFTIVQPTATLADPHILSDIRDRRSIIDAVYDALVRRDAHGQFVPWLATRWSVDAQCQRWRFELAAGVVFHNGTTLTAQHAADSLLRALSPDMPGELGTEGVLLGYLEGVKIRATDSLTLEIETLQPLADLLDLLVDIPVINSQSLPELIGSGPYQVFEAVTGKVVLDAFPLHWAGEPPVKRLIWLAEADPQRRIDELNQGRVDLVVDAPADYVASSQHALTFIKQKSHLCVIFLLNLFSGPTRDPNVRKALNHAINLQAIIDHPKIAAGQAAPLAGPLSLRHPGTPAALAPYRFDPALARELLVEAGYAKGLELQLALPARFPDESIPLAELIAAQLREVGVKANLTVYQDRPGYAHRVRDKKFGDIACFDSSPASAWRVYVEKLDSRRQGPWWQGYHSDALNALLDQIAATKDNPARAKLMEQAFRLVHDDAPWLFLYAPDTHWAISARFSGWQPTAEGRVRIIADTLSP